MLILCKENIKNNFTNCWEATESFLYNSLTRSCSWIITIEDPNDEISLAHPGPGLRAPCLPPSLSQANPIITQNILSSFKPTYTTPLQQSRTQSYVIYSSSSIHCTGELEILTTAPMITRQVWSTA
jgi:hypothetical protein